MLMRFAGQLQVPNDPGPGLKVVVDIHPDRMLITCGAEELGHWSLRDVRVAALDQDRFSLTVRDDRTIFSPDDPVRFSYDAMPLLGPESSGWGPLGRIWSWLSEPDLPELDEPEPYEADRPTLTLVEERPTSDGLVINLAHGSADLDERTTPGSCLGRRHDGQPCRSPILLASGYCAAHDPDYTPRRRAPGSSTRWPRLRVKLQKVIEGVESGEVDPQTALAVAGLVQAMCAVEELARRGPGDASTAPGFRAG